MDKMDKMDKMERTELGQFKSYKEVLNFTPRSVWDINARTKEIKEIFEDDLEKHSCKRTKDGVAVSIKRNFSVFNPILGKNILKIWSNDNDIVLDPFAGRDRALICNYYNRNYIGFEISLNTYLKLNEKLNNWKYLNSNYTVCVYNKNGLLLNEVKDNSVDFIFSCPPYWDKEKYESCEGQVSDIKTENEWKETISILAKNCYLKLKSNKFAVFVIADIRRNGKMIPLHSQWIDAFLNSGFLMKDIVINKLNPMNCSGINGYLKSRIMWKTHEYILVFQKG